MAIRLKQTPEISHGATERGAVDITKHLDGSETLTGTPTLVELSLGSDGEPETDANGDPVPAAAGDLTISAVAVSSAVLTIRRKSVSIGKAVTFLVSGAKDGTSYICLLTCATTAGRTLVFELPFTAT